MNFQYGWEPGMIQRILNGFDAIPVKKSQIDLYNKNNKKCENKNERYEDKLSFLKSSFQLHSCFFKAKLFYN